MLTEFEKLVSEMRKAQKDWFRWHEREALTKSKALERRVDEWLQQRQAADLTPDLFGGAGR